MAQELYVSTDIEADGPIPGPYSMLSFASAALTADKIVVGTFAANLETLPGATSHPDTMRFWAQHPAAYAATRVDLQTPEVAMQRYVAWLKQLPGTPVFVAYPATYDFMFVYWYLLRFAGESPFAHHGLDIRTFAMATLGTGYKQSGKNAMPAHWFEALPHTHNALDDAIEQGMLFCNMLRENRAALMLRPTD